MNTRYLQFGNISRSLNNQISDKSNYVTSDIFLLKLKMRFGSQIMLESIIIHFDTNVWPWTTKPVLSVNLLNK